MPTMKVVDVLGHRKVYNWYLNYLAICCLFIDREHVWKKYYAFMTIHTLIATAALFQSVIVYINDIDSLAVIMHHAMLLIDLVVAIHIFFYKRKIVRELVKGTSKSFDYESPLVSQFLDNIQEKREKTLKTVFKYIIFTAFFMQINVIIFGAVEKYMKNLDFMLLFPCWFPFDLSFLPNHIMAYLWQHLLLESLGCIICGAMTITYIVNSHLTSQIVLLKYSIEKLKARAYELAHSISEENPEGSYEERLKKCFVQVTTQCVKHYAMIIDYYTKSKDFFEIIYLMVFLTGLILLTSTGFALISENTSLKIKFIGVNAVQMIYLYVFCWLAENISDLGESIRLSIYGTEWHEMPKECQSSLKLMVERTLKPLDYYTSTGQKVDLENYMAMVKASYSYFNMMLATQQK